MRSLLQEPVVGSPARRAVKVRASSLADVPRDVTPPLACVSTGDDVKTIIQVVIGGATRPVRKVGGDINVSILADSIFSVPVTFTLSLTLHVDTQQQWLLHVHMHCWF